MRSLLSGCDFDNPARVCPAARCPVKCCSCGLHHRLVEGGGLWYCPNPLCSGPGGDWARRQVPSYEPHPDGTYSVETGDWHRWGLAYVVAHPELGERVAAAVARTVAARAAEVAP